MLRVLWLPVQKLLFLLGKLCQMMTTPVWGYPLGNRLLIGWTVYCFITRNTLWLPVLLLTGCLYVFSLFFGKSIRALAAWQPKSLAAPPPVVRVAVTHTSGNGETEADILRQLPPHLLALMRKDASGGDV